MSAIIHERLTESYRSYFMFATLADDEKLQEEAKVRAYRWFLSEGMAISQYLRTDWVYTGSSWGWEEEQLREQARAAAGIERDSRTEMEALEHTLEVERLNRRIAELDKENENLNTRYNKQNEKYQATVGELASFERGKDDKEETEV